MPEQFSPIEFWQEAETLGRAAQISLEYFQAMGLTALDIDIPAPRAPRPQSAAARPKPAEAPRREPPPRRAPTVVSSDHTPHPATWAVAIAELGELSEKTSTCRACLLNRESQQKPALGRGAATPLIAFVAATPAVFEGEAASLLSAMIEKALQLAPHEFYITSLIKCPLAFDADFPDQAASECLPIVQRELALLRPPIILALGQKPGAYLSGKRREHLLMLRKQTHGVDGLEKTWLRVTYSLEDLLSTPELKKEAWGDLQKIIPVLKKIRETS